VGITIKITSDETNTSFFVGTKKGRKNKKEKKKKN